MSNKQEEKELKDFAKALATDPPKEIEVISGSQLVDLLKQHAAAVAPPVPEHLKCYKGPPLTEEEFKVILENFGWYNEL